MRQSYLQTCQDDIVASIKEASFLTQDLLEKFTFNYELTQKLQDSAWGWLGANLKDDNVSE